MNGSRAELEIFAASGKPLSMSNWNRWNRHLKLK